MTQELAAASGLDGAGTTPTATRDMATMWAAAQRSMATLTRLNKEPS
jgi:hypothetical protein